MMSPMQAEVPCGGASGSGGGDEVRHATSEAEFGAELDSHVDETGCGQHCENRLGRVEVHERELPPGVCGAVLDKERPGVRSRALFPDRGRRVAPTKFPRFPAEL